MDISVENHGSIFLMRPVTPEGATWLAENIGEDAMYLGDALAVEPRYAEAIVEGMQDDGLEVA
jgi:hypothetical protein